MAAALHLSEDLLEPRFILGGPKPFTTALAQRIRRHILADAISEDDLSSLCFVLIVEMLRLPPEQRTTGRDSILDDKVLQSVLKFIDANLNGGLLLMV